MNIIKKAYRAFTHADVDDYLKADRERKAAEREAERKRMHELEEENARLKRQAR